MRSLLLVFSLALVAVCSLNAQSGYAIKAEIDGYEEEELYLGYYYGNKQYLVDTAQMKGGKFLFEDDEPLEPGVYLVVMAPDNNFFQILITEDEQQFAFRTSKDAPSEDMKLEQAPDNQLFYSYMNFLDEQKPAAEEIGKAMEAASSDKEKERLEAKRAKLDEKVKNYQETLIAKHPNTLTAAIINANLPLEMPEFEGTEEEVQRKRWRYSQKHYFDNIDLADPRMLRTPFLFQRVDHYVNKLQVQHPDTVARAVEYVLEQMRPAEESFKYYLIHFLNEAAKSKMVGMDAAYVYLVDKYYATGQASWTDEEQLEKIIDNAKTLKPLLIGKIAPDIQLQTKEGEPRSLHEIESEYTILYFWRYDCGHCKKSTPHMKEFYEKYKDKGVKLVSVCTKFTDEIEGCWDYIDENEIGDWMHLVDPYHRSRYMKVYNIKSTPQLYVLDRNKEILSKRIGAEQLEEVMDRIIEMREQEDANPNK
ncbi:MAG: thioredoxin-like domain-containing protein [Phaeodactylibacter xiamenensis]|uniref:TlpA family protein disulfide reductase n=1 Tax=Phaeodactylibacter xiamenensis TaxID=1524460 RepID=UPI000697B8D9|nr:TlpA family protein disulfide reductase [Phaeodactylibacter xiamenensis]MCR9050766.1 thioredoxin-like domain-containing protein [bacterium]